MVRGKFTMEYITTEKARKSSFKKRKEGLVKKIRELSVLCGIDACLIIYGPPNNDGSPTEVHTWPKESKEVESILRKYELKKNESSSKHLNLMDFFGNQTCKINEQIEKTRREIAKAKFVKSMEIRLEGLSVDDLKNMVSAMDKKIKTVTSSIEAARVKQKLSRGIGAVELMMFDEDNNVQILDSNSQQVRDASKIDIGSEYCIAQMFLGEQVTEHLKPMQLSVSDSNPYNAQTSLTDALLAQNNYQTDLLDDYSSNPTWKANDRSEYIVGPNCEPQYFQTSLYSADPIESNGIGHPALGSYIVAQQLQQQSVLTSEWKGIGFQSGDCFDNFCGWTQERNK